MRDAAKHVAVEEEDRGVLCAAIARRVPRDRIDDGLLIGGRVRYDAEDLSERSLPLERLLRLVEQPHILDRDDRLGGERLDQLHLVRSERDRLRFA